MTKETINKLLIDLQKLCEEYKEFRLGATIHSIPKEWVPESYQQEAVLSEDGTPYSVAKSNQTGFCVYVFCE